MNNPIADKKGLFRVTHSAWWRGLPNRMQVSYRSVTHSPNRHGDIGFRVVRNK